MKAKKLSVANQQLDQSIKRVCPPAVLTVMDRVELRHVYRTLAQLSNFSDEKAVAPFVEQLSDEVKASLRTFVRTCRKTGNRGGGMIEIMLTGYGIL